MLASSYDEIVVRAGAEKTEFERTGFERAQVERAPAERAPAVTAPATRAQGKAEAVFGRLRADILAGRHWPGQRLRYAELCETYRTSMGVLRECLLRLAEQGLVRGEPQQGFQVVSLSAVDLQELTEARYELETLTLRRALVDGDIGWESRLIAAHHRLRRTAQLDPEDPKRLSDAWVSAHAEFHNVLLDGCANQRLKSIAAALRDSAELYRRWSIPFSHGTDRDVAAEHDAILNAALARDVAEAVSLLSSHIQRTTNILLASGSATGLSEPSSVPPSSTPALAGTPPSKMAQQNTGQVDK